MDIRKIKPYKKNPRNNKKAVKYVAKSIEEFGFRSPIIVDKNHVIICGHTRYSAAKKLGLTDIPVIVADDLTDEQVKAYRLADNKVSEKATWDEGLLNLEMSEILDINMEDFGFQMPDIMEDDEPQQEKPNERERTANGYNLHDYDDGRATGDWDIPTLEKVIYTPDNLIGFNYVKSTPPTPGTGVHFFLDDYQFERIWNNPDEYCPMLAEYDCVLTPDFSLYMEMPLAMMLWNTYRSRLIGQILQDYGATVIPTVSLADKRSFAFCFDGLPQGGTIAVSTIGVKLSDEASQIWVDGMDECLKRAKPNNVIVYGGDIGYKFDCEVAYINNAVTERMYKQRGNDDED